MIRDDDTVGPPTITVSADDGRAGETGTGFGSGSIRFTRTGNVSGSLTVFFGVTGSATSGIDFSPLGNRVVFNPGSAFTFKTVSVIEDALAEGSESVVLSLSAGVGYVLGTPNSAEVVIEDDDLSTPLGAVDRSADKGMEKPATIRLKVSPGQTLSLGIDSSMDGGDVIIERSYDLKTWVPIREFPRSGGVHELDDSELDADRPGQQFFRVMPVPVRAAK